MVPNEVMDFAGIRAENLKRISQNKEIKHMNQALKKQEDDKFISFVKEQI